MLPGSSDHNMLSHVCSLITEGTWQQTIPGLEQLWQSILAIKLEGDEDSWVWLENASGKFSFGSAWQVCRAKHHQFQFFDVLCHTNYCPKTSYCLYKAMLNRLPTRERLVRFGILQENNRVLCNQDAETNNHLFFDCPFSQYIWRLCRLKLGIAETGIGSVRDEALKVKQKFNVKDKLFALSRLVLAGTVWNIWQERNRRIFQRQELNKIHVFRRLYDDILNLLRNCHWKSSYEVGDVVILSNWS